MSCPTYGHVSSRSRATLLTWASSLSLEPHRTAPPLPLWAALTSVQMQMSTWTVPRSRPLLPLVQTGGVFAPEVCFFFRFSEWKYVYTFSASHLSSISTLTVTVDSAVQKSYWPWQKELPSAAYQCPCCCSEMWIYQRDFLNFVGFCRICEIAI